MNRCDNDPVDTSILFQVAPQDWPVVEYAVARYQHSGRTDTVEEVSRSGAKSASDFLRSVMAECRRHFPRPEPLLEAFRGPLGSIVFDLYYRLVAADRSDAIDFLRRVQSSVVRPLFEARHVGWDTHAQFAAATGLTPSEVTKLFKYFLEAESPDRKPGVSIHSCDEVSARFARPIPKLSVFQWSARESLLWQLGTAVGRAMADPEAKTWVERQQSCLRLVGDNLPSLGRFARPEDLSYYAERLTAIACCPSPTTDASIGSYPDGFTLEFPLSLRDEESSGPLGRQFRKAAAERVDDWVALRPLMDAHRSSARKCADEWTRSASYRLTVAELAREYGPPHPDQNRLLPGQSRETIAETVLILLASYQAESLRAVRGGIENRLDGCQSFPSTFSSGPVSKSELRSPKRVTAYVHNRDSSDRDLTFVRSKSMTGELKLADSGPIVLGVHPSGRVRLDSGAGGRKSAVASPFAHPANFLNGPNDARTGLGTLALESGASQTFGPAHLILLEESARGLWSQIYLWQQLNSYSGGSVPCPWVPSVAATDRGRHDWHLMSLMEDLCTTIARSVDPAGCDCALWYIDRDADQLATLNGVPLRPPAYRLASTGYRPEARDGWFGADSQERLAELNVLRGNTAPEPARRIIPIPDPTGSQKFALELVADPSALTSVSYEEAGELTRILASVLGDFEKRRTVVASSWLTAALNEAGSSFLEDVCGALVIHLKTLFDASEVAIWIRHPVEADKYYFVNLFSGERRNRYLHQPLSPIPGLVPDVQGYLQYLVKESPHAGGGQCEPSIIRFSNTDGLKDRWEQHQSSSPDATSGSTSSSESFQTATKPHDLSGDKDPDRPWRYLLDPYGYARDRRRAEGSNRGTHDSRSEPDGHEVEAWLIGRAAVTEPDRPDRPDRPGLILVVTRDPDRRPFTEFSGDLFAATLEVLRPFFDDWSTNERRLLIRGLKSPTEKDWPSRPNPKETGPRQAAEKDNLIGNTDQEKAHSKTSRLDRRFLSMPRTVSVSRHLLHTLQDMMERLNAQSLGRLAVARLYVRHTRVGGREVAWTQLAATSNGPAGRTDETDTWVASQTQWNGPTVERPGELIEFPGVDGSKIVRLGVPVWSWYQDRAVVGVLTYQFTDGGATLDTEMRKLLSVSLFGYAHRIAVVIAKFNCALIPSAKRSEQPDITGRPTVVILFLQAARLTKQFALVGTDLIHVTAVDFVSRPPGHAAIRRIGFEQVSEGDFADYGIILTRNERQYHMLIPLGMPKMSGGKSRFLGIDFIHNQQNGSPENTEEVRWYVGRVIAKLLEESLAGVRMIMFVGDPTVRDKTQSESNHCSIVSQAKDRVLAR